MILSDSDIVKAVNEGRLGIDPFDEGGLTPNGYDLRINEMRGDPGPKCFFLVSTLEFIRLPRDVCAQLWIRSSFARKGVFCSFGKVDAGFEGALTVGCFNSGEERIGLNKGERFIQIVFEKMLSPAEKEYSGKYRGQRGIRTG